LGRVENRVLHVNISLKLKIQQYKGVLKSLVKQLWKIDEANAKGEE
jgi:hypothetical protein